MGFNVLQVIFNDTQMEWVVPHLIMHEISQESSLNQICSVLPWSQFTAKIFGYFFRCRPTEDMSHQIMRKKRYTIWPKVCGCPTVTLIRGPSPNPCHKVASKQLYRMSLHAVGLCHEDMVRYGWKKVEESWPQPDWRNWSLLTQHQYLISTSLTNPLVAEWAQIPHSHAPKSSGTLSQKNGAYYGIRVGINLEWDVQQAHMGVTTRSPYPSHHIVYFWVFIMWFIQKYGNIAHSLLDTPASKAFSDFN